MWIGPIVKPQRCLSDGRKPRDLAIRHTHSPTNGKAYDGQTGRSRGNVRHGLQILPAPAPGNPVSIALRIVLKSRHRSAPKPRRPVRTIGRHGAANDRPRPVRSRRPALGQSTDVPVPPHPQGQSALLQPPTCRGRRPRGLRLSPARQSSSSMMAGSPPSTTRRLSSTIARRTS